MSLKKTFQDAYGRLRFRLSSSDSPVFILYYKYLFRPKKGSLAYYFDLYSKHRKGHVTIIQVGANDGITHDPVHKFIKRDGWRGVLLEPQKYVFDNFLRHIYHKNKNIITVNAALGHEDGYLSIYKIGFSEERWASGLTSFDKEVLKKRVESDYVTKKAKAANIEIPASREEWIAEEKVQVLSFDTLLDRYGLAKVNLLQIDAEGFDYEIIKMINFRRIMPDIIAFESALLPTETYDECTAYLSGFGYAFHETEGSTLCVHRSLDFMTDLIRA